MAERLSSRREKTGIDRSTLHLCGVILLALGMLSRGVLQNRLLGVTTGSSQQLLEILDMSGGMTAAAVALALEALESCAVPIFATLLLDGFLRTGSFRKYLLRVLAVAAVSEVPYNLLISGKLWDVSSRNPVFASVLVLIMLYLYHTYEERTFRNGSIKLFVTVAALLWAVIFRVQYGVSLLVVVCVLWTFRDRKALKNFLGAAAAICCCIGNPLYMFSPFGFLIAHGYNGEQGNPNRMLRYALYPLLLVLVYAVGLLLF